MADDNVDERDYNLDETAKKTGEKRKSILFAVGGAALGALLGDIFSVREHDVSYDFTYYGTQNVHTRTFHDEGGFFDLAHKDANGNFVFGGDNADHDQYIDKLKEMGYVPQDSISGYDGFSTLTGMGGGALGGFAASWASKKLKKAEKEETENKEGKFFKG